MSSPKSRSLSRRIDAALARIPCDLVLKNARFLDVYSCTFRKGDLSVIDGVIVGIEPGLKGTREIDLKGKHVVPGFIDAHVHVESSLMVPEHFEAAVLKCGTTSAICDPHELANVQGVSGIEYFLKASERLTLDLHVMLSSCVPATHMETNGGGTIQAEALAKLASHPRALGLAEGSGKGQSSGAQAHDDDSLRHFASRRTGTGGAAGELAVWLCSRVRGD